MIATNLSIPNLRCPISTDIDRHLSEQDAEDLRQEAISEMAEEMLSGEYSPWDASNLSEAIGEMDMAKIGNLFASGGAEGAGKYIEKMAMEYWLDQARRDAEIKVDTQLCLAEEQWRNALLGDESEQ